MDENDDKNYRLSVSGGLVALAVAIALAFLFYFLVGFPVNVPLALGVSVLVVEMAEGVLRHGKKPGDLLGTVLIHSILAAGAAWLGAVVVRAIA